MYYDFVSHVSIMTRDIHSTSIRSCVCVYPTGQFWYFVDSYPAMGMTKHKTLKMRYLF